MAQEIREAALADLQPLNGLLEQRLRNLIGSGRVQLRPGGRLYFSVDPVSYHIDATTWHSEDDDPHGEKLGQMLGRKEIAPVLDRWEKEHPELFECMVNDFGVAFLEWLAERWASVGGPAAYPGAFANLSCSEDESPFDLDSRRFFPWNDYIWNRKS
jgi:hypothetical protein